MAETFYLCAVDGYHPDNSVRWCGSGCGSDFNRMIRVELPAAFDAAAEKIRELDRWRTDANGRAYRAEKRVAELEALAADVVEPIPPDGPDEDWYAAREALRDALKGENVDRS